MTKYDNTKQVPKVTAGTSGTLYLDRQQYDLANAPDLANGDLLQVAVVPAGCVLVPHLTRLTAAKLDTSGTGKFSVGTSDDSTALAAAQDGSAAVTLAAGDLTEASVGSATEDTPIYLALTAALGTQATSGQVVTDLVVRAFEPGIDG